MKILNLKSPIFSEFAIVDNEISNDISDKFDDWHYEKADIICCGILYHDDIIILFKEKGENLEEYKETLKANLMKFDCFFAFNRSMEYGNFKGFLGKIYDVREIKPFKGKGWNKQKFFTELVFDGKVKIEDCPIDPMENDSGECIKAYANEEYQKIINHNVADLIKQALILNHTDYFKEKYKDRLDKNGWYN